MTERINIPAASADSNTLSRGRRQRPIVVDPAEPGEITV